jgi:hypothetical protein
MHVGVQPGWRGRGARNLPRPDVGQVMNVNVEITRSRS